MPMSRWARQKLTRSWWLFSELLGRVDAWNAAGQFTAAVHVLPDRTALEFLTPAGFRPPVSEWALLTGDAVHNARSALDAEIWHLAHRDGGEPTTPTRIAFPVASDARAWANSIKALETVPAESLERVRLAQPWVVSPTTPDQHWLSILSRLDNDDKHRGRVVAVPLEEGLIWRSMASPSGTHCRRADICTFGVRVLTAPKPQARLSRGSASARSSTGPRPRLGRCRSTCPCGECARPAHSGRRTTG